MQQNILGCTTASIFIVAVGYAKNKGIAIGLLCMGVGVTGLNATGYAVNILDIAPKYAGVIIGISNVFGSMPGFISPQIVGYITTKNVSIYDTHTVINYHNYFLSPKESVSTKTLDDDGTQ